MTMFASVESRMEALTAHMETRDQEIRQELAIYKTAVSAQVMATHEAPRVEVPKPHTFSGKRDAKELDNFLWHMEHYFKAIALTNEATKVRTTTLYLTDNATLWWSRRFADIEKGTCTIDTWDAFRREIKRQLYPEDVAYLARKSLKSLKHTGSIREYVKDFSMLMLEIPNMAEEELLFNFMDNLQSWAEQELRRRGVQDLATAMAVAKSLVDYRRGDSSKPKPPSKGNQAKGGGDKGSQGHTFKEGSSKGPSGKDGKGKDKQKEFTPKTNCFLCDGPHWARDYPKRKALNVMIKEKEQEGDAKVGSLQLLNSLKGKPMPKTPQSKGLMYVEAFVNGKATKALVDTGATHNFVSEDEARRLELQASKEGGWLKAVNLAAKPSHGVVRGMTMHIGSWERRVKAVPLPFLRSMAVLEEEKSCMVPTVTKGTLKIPMLSATQVKKGLKRKEVTYLATLKEEKDDGSGEPMPKEIKGVLDEFKDMMPPELPKRLPPRREEDHKIELESGAKPPAMGPYRMAQPELEELRRQLKELLDAGFIEPSKAPYGVSVLFQKKHDGSLRMARYFTKLDLRSGYYQLRIAERDEPKTTCVTMYGSYEFLVMPFGLTNAPTTFYTLMNKIFHPYLDKFVVVYLDDIVIYSNTLKEHVEHLRKVFKILRQNELYMKNEKCSFAREEVSFLGHRIRDGKLMMDDSKVKAIQEWDPQTKGFSARAAPLTDLLKKNKAWEWDERCQQAFEDLKRAVTEEPVLALPDHTKGFEVHTDASDFAIGGVLMQEMHTIAFESRKLNDAKRRYTVQEKEMTAIVHCLCTWRHYLLGSHFIVKIDNVEQRQPRGLLEPLPIAKRPWDSVTMDFIIGLPKSEDSGSIIVVVDRFSKYATFIAAPTDCTAEETTRLFLKHVLKYWGLPKFIISDHDMRFTRKFWTELFKLMGSELHFSTSFHPQTDGQTERVNALLELYLRHFVSANQKDWAKLLDIAQFSYNLQRSEATNKSPFELATGQQPLTSHTLMISYTGRSPAAFKFMKGWHEQADIVHSYLDKAA
uniref:Retrovirus-related Pol polyprotein from transposon 17.6 n=1 Tax=Vitis vinifera TaxID=29760 RepID=A5BEX7_VITVI|nr:hypothetical protein VITISV_020215 [Vitis vinifera]